MTVTNNDTSAGNTAAPRQLTAADLGPGTLGWGVQVAMGAHRFFKMPHGSGVAAVIGKTVHPTNYDPWSVADYSKYLSTQSLRDAGTVVALTQITRAMEPVGFLLPCGTAPHTPRSPCATPRHGRPAPPPMAFMVAPRMLGPEGA
jgi:hypothetical protein